MNGSRSDPTVERGHEALEIVPVDAVSCALDRPDLEPVVPQFLGGPLTSLARAKDVPLRQAYGCRVHSVG